VPKISDDPMLERRFVTIEQEAAVPLLTVETRSAKNEDGSDGEPEEWIVGYAARFDTDSLDLGEFTERIAPEAFGLVTERRGRKNPLDTRALFNHDPNYVLGRLPDTLRMTVDEVGLRYEVKPPAAHAGIVESIRRGDVRGSSFAFIVARDGESWTVDERGRHIRTITRVSDLLDVGPVTYPAYPDSSVTVARRSYDLRSLAAAERRKAVQGYRSVISLHEEWLHKNGKR
jgi:HK97 family phage prohead protease